MNKKLADSLLKIGKLKSLKRTGWVREGMPDPESVAEHTFRVCLMVVFLGKNLQISEEKLLKMAVLHDIEEVVTNDPVTQRTAVDTRKVCITEPPWPPVADPGGPYNTRVKQEIELDGS
ncbi:MAG: HD domain-containing protein, partial [Patescibacteria group bacterium]